ncbi:Fic family protein [Methanoregula sp.]|jgi:Fic family protein|uniref:Fic family protein n=1 Tax=Methanoregula sp. TaxID=2052170 RepID=UPI003C792BEB
MGRKAGEFARNERGYDVFIPNPLPPEIIYDDELHFLLSKADAALARLDGVTEVLPNPDIFVAMYVKKEALLSAQIEGTQVSLQGVLEFEANLKPKEDIRDIREVINYIKAMNFGINQLQQGNLNLALINASHKTLITGTRGSDKSPGKYKDKQNFLGTPGGSIFQASFIPPSPEKIEQLMLDLEKFIQEKDRLPTLIKAALMHAQFETIHPYLDGNGRMGRLLITYYLYWTKSLSRPLLYLSFYLKKYKSEYSENLNKVRFHDDWEAWLKFFLKGVIEVSENAIQSAREIIALKENSRNKLIENKVGGTNAIRLLDLLFDSPTVSIKEVADKLKISPVAANKLVNKMAGLGILQEITGKERYQIFAFVDFIKIIEKGTRV